MLKDCSIEERQARVRQRAVSQSERAVSAHAGGEVGFFLNIFLSKGLKGTDNVVGNEHCGKCIHFRVFRDQIRLSNNFFCCLCFLEDVQAEL